jgi:structure-specific endonuclease subunit SLX1
MTSDPPSCPPPEAVPGEWWVYVLWSDTLGRTYVGTTTDIGRRMRQHNGELWGGARATRAGRPWRLGAANGPYPDRSEATRAELALKHKRGRARLSF